MNSELFFIYDSHCPWSYATTQLVNEIAKVYPDMPMHLWHCAHYNGSDSAGANAANIVAQQSVAKFDDSYTRFADSPQDATMTANFMAWMQNKNATQSLDVLTAIQNEHFCDGNAFNNKDDFDGVLSQFNLSPPKKVFKSELSKEAQYVLGDIAEIQEIIDTTAFPAVLLAVNERLVLLNHNLYLTKPDAIVEAVALEMKQG